MAASPDKAPTSTDWGAALLREFVATRPEDEMPKGADGKVDIAAIVHLMLAGGTTLPSIAEGSNVAEALPSLKKS